MVDKELIEEVLKLTLRCQESDPTEDDCARLNVLLSDNEEARTIYLLACRDTATLLGSSRTLKSNIAKKWSTKLVFAVAASVLLTVGTVAFLRFDGLQGLSPAVALSEEPETVGRIVSLSNVKWSEEATQYKEWSPFAAGQSIRIDAGVVELMLENSTEILLEGPADFRLISLGKAALRNGTLVARCGPDAVGFEVESPEVKIVDLGTEFAVAVREGLHTDVVVYDGEVDLLSRGTAAQLERRLSAGEALHIPRIGNSARITEVSGR